MQKTVVLNWKCVFHACKCFEKVVQIFDHDRQARSWLEPVNVKQLRYFYFFIIHSRIIVGNQSYDSHMITDFTNVCLTISWKIFIMFETSFHSHAVTLTYTVDETVKLPRIRHQIQFICHGEHYSAWENHSVKAFVTLTLVTFTRLVVEDDKFVN